MDDLEDMLGELSCSPSLFSALKIRFDQNVEDGSWVWRASPLANRQLHLVGHEREEGQSIDIYAHLERSKISNPIKHYRKVDYDAEAGVAMFRDMLAWYHRKHANAPRYAIHPPRSRLSEWTLHTISYLSTPAAMRIGQIFDHVSCRLRNVR